MASHMRQERALTVGLSSACMCMLGQVSVAKSVDIPANVKDTLAVFRAKEHEWKRCAATASACGAACAWCGGLQLPGSR